jgi:AcrR family transcriptional regulator
MNAAAVSPLARPNLRNAQKIQTRALIRDSARNLFHANGYHATTIDQIVAAAGAGRQTFYLHFSDKEDVLRAVIADHRPRAVAQMETLQGPAPSLGAILAWLTEFKLFLIREKASIVVETEVGATAAVLPDYLREMIDAKIDALGRNLAAFAAVRRPGEIGLEARARAELAIIEIFWAGKIAARDEETAYGEAVLKTVAKSLHAFIHDPRFAGSKRK